MKSLRISIDETIPFTTPFWIASGVSDCGIATGIPPSRFTTSAFVPATRSSIPLRSASDLTGVFVMKLVGGQVKSVRTLTCANSFGLYFSIRSNRVRLAARALVNPIGRSTASETGNRPGW